MRQQPKSKQLSPSNSKQQSSPNPGNSIASLDSTREPKQLAARAAHARNPSPIGSIKRSRKVSINNGHAKPRQPRESSKMRYDNQPEALQSVVSIRPADASLAVQGDPKMINNRSHNADELNDVINYRLQQHQNEGTQANFETYSNYGHMTMGEPLSPLRPANQNSPSPTNAGYELAPQLQKPKNTKQAQLVRGTRQEDLGRLLESRSSILIPAAASSQQQESKLYDSTSVHKRLINDGERASIDSDASLPYNTDINVEKIQIRQSSKDGASSPKAMRKAATNANMMQMSQKQPDRGTDRKQNNSLLELNRPQQRDSGDMPVIITSMIQDGARKAGHNIVFDVRSETPQSQNRHHKAGQPEDTRTHNISASDTPGGPPNGQEDQGQVRVSSPVRLAALQKPQVLVNSVGEPYQLIISNPQKSPEKSKKDLHHSAAGSSNYRGLNTMSISLFEESLFKNPNQVSPFRQSTVLKGNQAKMLANLEQLANSVAGIGTGADVGSNGDKQQGSPKSMINYIDEKGDPTNLHIRREGSLSGLGGVDQQEILPALNAPDESTRRIFKQAMLDHEKQSKKKWRIMTPYERSKVLETFVRLQRDEREAHKVLDAKDPRRIQTDLSMCISVGEIKPGPNPHIQLMEKKFGVSPRSNKSGKINFDKNTLRDPSLIVKKVVKMKTQETIEDAEEITSQKNDCLAKELNNVGNITPEMVSMRESQMMEELQKVRDQKEILMKENSDYFKDDNQINIMPQKSVLHLRYPFASDHSVIDSNMQSFPQLRPMHMSPTGERALGVNQSDLSTAMRVDSDIALAGNISPAMVFGNHERQAIRQTVERNVQIKTQGRNSDLEPVQQVDVLDDVQEMLALSQQMQSHQQSQNILPSVPEEQVYRTVDNTLVEKIKETLLVTETNSMMTDHLTSSRRSNEQLQQHIELHVTALKKEQYFQTPQKDPLLEMTQMSLQAISLTRQHQMNSTQVKVTDAAQTTFTDDLNLRKSPSPQRKVGKSYNNNYLRPSPLRARATAAANMTKQMNLTKLFIQPGYHRPSVVAEQNTLDRSGNADESTVEANGHLTDLKPQVQQQHLNKPKVAATAIAQVIQRNHDELANIPKFIQDNTAKVEHPELRQLENRLRDQSGINKVDSTAMLSERVSQLTHIKDPKLVRNFQQQTHVLEKLIVEQSSERNSEHGYKTNDVGTSPNPDAVEIKRQDSTMMMNSQDSSGMVPRPEASRQVIHISNRSQHDSKIDLAANQTSYLEVLSGQQAIGGTRSSARESGEARIAERVQIVNLSRIGEGVIKQEHSHITAQSSEQEVLEHRLDDQSVITHQLPHEKAGIDSAVERQKNILGAGFAGIANEVNLLNGAVSQSITFYNEQLNSLDGKRKNDDTRAKVQSQLTSPRKRDQSDSVAKIEDVTFKKLDQVTILSQDNTPKPIVTQTPVKLVRDKELIHITGDDEQRTPDETINIDQKQNKVDAEAAQVDEYPDNVTGFHQTANFASQMNRSTGLPIRAQAATEHRPEPLLNPLKQSFATTISVLGTGAADTPSEGPSGWAHQLNTKFQYGKKKFVGGSARRVGSTFVGGAHLSQYGQSQSIAAYSARLSTMDAGSESRRQTSLHLKDEVFIDKRIRQGQKLFVGVGPTSPNVKTTVNAANLGFALSPLARRGQQVIAHGTLRRRQVAQQKTPLSKLLTSNEMAEFQRVLGSTGKQRQRPGDHFNNGPPTRERNLNQVSATRIVNNHPYDSVRTSKLELHTSSLAAFDPGSPRNESPTMGRGNPLSPLMASGRDQIMTDDQTWQPIQAKPTFGLVKLSQAAEKRQLLNESQDSFSKEVPQNEIIQLTRTGNDKAEGNSHAATRYGANKTGKRWHGGTMRSTRYLNNSVPVDPVKLIGSAAPINQVLNSTESKSKIGLSDLNSVISSKQQMKRVYRPDTMKVSQSSNTDDAEAAPPLTGHEGQSQSIEAKTIVPTTSQGGSIRRLSQDLDADGVMDGALNQGSVFISPTDSKVLLKPTLNTDSNTQSSAFPNVALLPPKTSSRCQSVRGSKLSNYIEQEQHQYAMVEDLLVRVAKGVLPRYKVELSKKREVAQQARQRYISPVNKDSSIMPIQVRRRQHNNQTYASLANSRNKLQQQRSSTQTKNIFVFNDVKNWKQNLAKHSHLVSGTQATNSRTIDVTTHLPAQRNVEQLLATFSVNNQ